jgi:PhnB protein
MQIQPYLFFDGRCEEAVEFYRQALGAEVDMLMRYRENPESSACSIEMRPDVDDLIMHASLRVGDAVIMASDDCTPEPRAFGGFSLSIGVPDAGTADRMFAALADGGEVQMPLGRTFFSPRFGMVVDRFGVSWMVNVTS